MESTPKKTNPLKNIDMSHIRISDLPIPNPEKLFRNYNDKNVTDMSAYERYINAVSLIFSSKMQDIVPMFSASFKNTLYKNQISEIMKSTFRDIYSNEPSPSQDKNENDNEKKKDSQGRRQKPPRSKRGFEKPEITETAQKAEKTDEHNDPPATLPPRRERPSSGVSRRRFR